MISRAPLTGVSALNQLAAQVVEIGAGQPDEPFERQVRLDCGSVSLLARVTAKSVSELALKPGDRVIAVVKSVSIKSPGDV
jgi:molybdopterin-binding protein